MKKKIMLCVLLSTNVLAGPNVLGQGGMGSGGGASIVCRDSQSKIVKAELLDLAEAKAQGLTLKQQNGGLYNEYIRYTQTVNIISGFGMPAVDDIRDHLDKTLILYTNFLPRDEKLALLDDVGEINAPLPEGCKLEQLAVYDDTANRLDINSEIWDSLDGQNQAALMAHEEIYKAYRKTQDVTSQETRKLVGLLFSTTPPQPQLKGIPWEKALYCYTYTSGQAGRNSGSLFFVYPDVKDPSSSIIQIYRIVGRDTYGLTQIKVPASIQKQDLDIYFPGNGAQSYQIVTNADVNLNKTFTVDAGIFTNFKVTVNYSFGSIFSVTLVNSQNRIIDKGLVNGCYPALYLRPNGR